MTVINAVMGTLIAWVLVRDRFPGKGFVNSLIDLPFALPTIVAGLTLLALYGPRGPTGINIAFTKAGIVVALLLVTLPFVVRAVQPVLLELDREMEQAAASLGAGPFAIFRRIIFPNLLPAVIGGCGLAFSRALGEFGSLVLIIGNIPFDDQVASFYIYSQIESGQPHVGRSVSPCSCSCCPWPPSSSCPASSAGAPAMPDSPTALPSPPGRPARRARRPPRWPAATACASSPWATSPSSWSRRSRWSSGTPSTTGSARPGTRSPRRPRCTRSS